MREITRENTVKVILTTPVVTLGEGTPSKGGTKRDTWSHHTYKD